MLRLGLLLLALVPSGCTSCSYASSAPASDTFSLAAGEGVVRTLTLVRVEARTAFATNAQTFLTVSVLALFASDDGVSPLFSGTLSRAVDDELVQPAATIEFGPKSANEDPTRTDVGFTVMGFYDEGGVEVFASCTGDPCEERIELDLIREDQGSVVADIELSATLSGPSASNDIVQFEP